MIFDVTKPLFCRTTYRIAIFFVFLLKQTTTMRRFLTTILILVVAICSVTNSQAEPRDKKQQFPTMFAHRGCWSKNTNGEFIIPENSVAAVAMAKRMGYAGIECDVHYTKDKRMVILHDATLNRTARNAADYSKLDKPVRLADLTFEELRRDYVLESANPELRTPIPTLEELLEECKRQGIIPMLHSAVWESYEVAQKMFGNDWICFTGGVEHMQKVRKFSDCTILLAINDGTAEENIARLQKIGGHCGISTMNYKLYTPQFCKALTDAGYEVQASIFPAPHEAVAQRNGVTYQLTDFSFMPPAGKRAYDKLKVNVGWQNAIGLGVNQKKRNKDHHFDCEAVVCEIKTRNHSNGTITVKIDNKEYKFDVRDKEKIYVGSRFFDQNAAPKFNINHSNRAQKSHFCVKRLRYYIYDM